MKCVLAFIIIICLLISGSWMFLWSGRYNVAADQHHSKIAEWFLSNIRYKSIAAHSEVIVVPPVEDRKLLATGLRHYDEMCRLCHNAPGYSRSDVARGLYPAPPDFSSREVRVRAGNAEAYWVVKHGIKMTGMASFGTTHSEEEILVLVSMVRRVREMKPGEYAAMLKAAGVHGQHEHHH